jgi:uncharacterized damage-inducible protein DinB
MTFTEYLLPEFDDEMKNTRKMLERVPDGKFDFQPHPKSMTLARLATHVAELPHWACMTVDLEVLEIPADYKPTFAASQAELLNTFDAKAAEAREKIAATTDEQWAKTWTLKFGGQTILSMPRSQVMRGMVMNHLVHHRAQLGVFLRLLDVPIPGAYGPSADEM